MQITNWTETIVFIVYLLFMIGVGLVFFLRSKNAGEKEYFLGGRHMGPWVSALSTGPSDMSAWVLMGIPTAIYAAGLGKDGRCQITGSCAPAAAPACAPCSERHNDAPAAAGFQGKLITEYEIKQLCKQGVKALNIAKGQIITPLAKDTAKACGISLTYGG